MFLVPGSIFSCLRYEVWGLKQNLSQYSILKISYQLSVVWGLKHEAWSMKKAVNLKLALNSLCSLLLVLFSVVWGMKSEVWSLRSEAESIPILYTHYSILTSIAATKMNFHLHFIVYPTIFAFHFKRSFFLNLIAR